MRGFIIGILGLAMFSMSSGASPKSTNLRDYDLLISSASYATGVLKNGVFRVNPMTGETLGQFGCGAKIVDPRGIRLSPGGKHVLVANGDDKVLVFAADTGQFSNELLPVQGLNPGGVKFGRDGRFYVGARSARTIVAFDVSGKTPPSTFVPGSYVKFPRGLAAAPSGFIYLASGTDPASGEGQNTVLRFNQDGSLDQSFKVVDADLSPTDTDVAPSGNLLSHSEFPFKDPKAIATVREYDWKTGRLVRVFDAGSDETGQHIEKRPRGITVGPDGMLYASSQDHVVRFNLETGKFDKIIFSSPGINAQSIIFVPRMKKACTS